MPPNVVINLWRQRIGYGIADLGCNLVWQMLTIYLIFFYTETMGIAAVQVSLLLLITRLIDGGFDLLMGFIIDQTNTRWGKSRPYFLWGAFPFAIFSMLVFYVPPFSAAAKLAYAYMTYTALSLCYTVVNMPLTSILPSLTNDVNERTVLATSRILFSFIGATIVGSLTIRLVYTFNEDGGSLGFFKTMIIYGSVAAITLFITFFNVKEANPVITQQVPNKQSFRLLLKNTPWLLFAVNIIFMWGAYFLQQGSLVYFYTYTLKRPDLISIIITLTAVIPIAGTFLAPYLARHFYKKNLFLLSSGVHLFGILLIALSGSLITGIVIGTIVSSIGFGLRHAIYFSMQADPVDYGEWKTGVNSAGMIAATNQFIGKIAMAGGGAIAGIVLTIGGYLPHQQQTAKTLLAININFLYLPAVLIIISMTIMWFYKLDEIFAKVRSDLEHKSSKR